MSNTFENPKESNLRVTKVKIPDREQKILRECYESAGEPQPDGHTTLSHNTAMTDWFRAILRGEVSPSEVEASEPESTDESTYLPLEIRVTQDEYAMLKNSDIHTVSSREAYRRNSEFGQWIRTVLQEFCNKAVQ